MKRRKFLKISAPLSIAPLVINGIPLSSFATPGMLAMCDGIDERVLVIIQLSGGNDGLNMVVPINQYDNYANIRPNVALAEADLINLDSTLPLEDQIGLHPVMTGVKDLYDAGKANIIQAVAYDAQNKSHFKSTDLWLSGGDGTPENFNINTGWMGRYLSSRFPGHAGNPTALMPDPLGIQLGDSKPSLGFHSDEEHETAINLSGQDPSGFYTLISEIGGAPLDNIPASEYGDELEYIMNVENSVSNYAQRISDVFDAGSNSATYPSENLANQLKTVARLLSGGSKTRIFLVKMGGYDTHVNQVDTADSSLGNHATLLGKVANAIKAFQDDLDALNLSDKVLTISFSEFGRKAEENGNFGTDHGTLASMLLFGNAVEPGITGSNVDLSNLVNGQLQDHQHDYRQVFTTLLQDWMGADDTILEDTMFGTYIGSKLPFINGANIVDPSCYSGPLPVELSFFKARVVDNKQVVLSWDTASEVNSDFFEIERSADGTTFEAIIRTIAKGNSTLVNHYQEVDGEPLTGTSYYRLRQVDQDERFTYSDIAVVEITKPSLTGIRLYPNPAVYDFQLAFMSEQSGVLEVRILNTSGRLLRERSLSVRSGFNKFAFPVAQLANGNYVVEIFSKSLEVKEAIPFIKQ